MTGWITPYKKFKLAPFKYMYYPTEGKPKVIITTISGHNSLSSIIFPIQVYFISYYNFFFQLCRGHFITNFTHKCKLF